MNEILQLRPSCEDSIIGFGASADEWESNRAYLKEVSGGLGCDSCSLDCSVKQVLETSSHSEFRSKVDTPVLPGNKNS